MGNNSPRDNLPYPGQLGEFRPVGRVDIDEEFGGQMGAGLNRYPPIPANLVEPRHHECQCNQNTEGHDELMGRA